MRRVEGAGFLVWHPLSVPLDFYPSEHKIAYAEVEGLAFGVVAFEGVEDKLEVGLFLGTSLVQVRLCTEKLCVGYAYLAVKERDDFQFCGQARSMKHGAVLLVLKDDVVDYNAVP